MSLAVAIQMDPMESVNIDADSTFALALEAKARGHLLYHYLPSALALREGRVVARANPLEVRWTKGDHFTLGEPRDRKSTRLNSSHIQKSRMPSSA